jgi:hypothetical protein
VTRSDARAPARPSSGRTWGLVALIWAVAVAFVLEVASDTRLGPVVYKITKTHGVHLGDVYATLGCAAIALLLSLWVITDHRGRKRRYQRYLERRQLLAEAPMDAPVEPSDELPLEEQPTVLVAYDEPYSEPHDEEFDYYDDRPAAYEEATQEIPRGRHALDD